MNKTVKKAKEILSNLSPIPRKLSLKEKMASFLLGNGNIKIIILVVILGILAGIIYWKNQTKAVLYAKYSPNQIREYWKMQETLNYDPTDYILLKDDITVVDIRPKVDYDKEHVIRAINIPVKLKEEDPSQIQNAQEVRQSFKKLDKQKEIVIYGENKYSATPLKTAALLSDSNIPVRIMIIGWNEFRHFPTFWMPEKLWGKADISNFIETNEFSQ